MSVCTAEQLLPEVMEAFDFNGPVLSTQRFGGGHVNDTFLLHTRAPSEAEGHYILQRLSSVAFKHPDEVMSNIMGVSEYLGRQIRSQGGNPARESMAFMRTRTGDTYYTDSCGNAWRAYPFIDNIACYDTAETPAVFAASGRAFGRFQSMLVDYPADTLYETIPHFHDTEDRLAKLKHAVETDPLGRAHLCRKEIDFALAREADCSVVMEAQRKGILPLRVTHNDTKLNNVLLDPVTGEGVCVINLDTVMPGLSINDFGDSIRFGANHCAEDEQDLSKMYLDLEMFAAYTKGFLEGAGGSLTDAEVAYMPWGARLMTLECGIRFLTDYLLGDTYFHTQRPGQNLDRCRTQFKLVEDMEAHWDEMNEIVSQFRKKD